MSLTSALVVSAVMEFFPRGIAPYLVGGLLIGLGTAIIYLGTGISAGAHRCRGGRGPPG